MSGGGPRGEEKVSGVSVCGCNRDRFLHRPVDRKGTGSLFRRLRSFCSLRAAWLIFYCARRTNCIIVAVPSLLVLPLPVAGVVSTVRELHPFPSRHLHFRLVRVAPVPTIPQLSLLALFSSSS